MEKYRILLTKGSFEALRCIRGSDRESVSSFLTYLMDGNWERNGSTQFPVVVWKQINGERYLFSCEIREELYAIWEVLWTVNLAGRLKISRYAEEGIARDFSLHIILYSLGEFPGQPDTLIHLGTEDFEKVGTIERRYLNFYDREPTDEVRYNEELYYLRRALIERVLRGEQRGLVLHMPEEQVAVLSAHRTLRGPILLSGEAGSGKTTVITHWLVMGELDKIVPQLFVTFSKRLTEQARIEFEQMLPIDHGPHQVRFLTYRELLLEIASAGGLASRDLAKEMTLERFLREYRKRVSPQVDLVLLWDEIRSVIKGRCEDSNKRILDYSTYEMLSEERGQCKTPKRMREMYYEEAQKYQNYLDREGLWDAVDLAFDCLGCADKVQKYARLACDEVQDLAPVEIRVLINLVKDNNIDSMFFTGDMAQVINPSGFLWSKLKGDLGAVSKRHDIRDPWTLKRNFRSTSEIVELVNECLRVRENLLGDAGERNIQHSYVRGGIKPMLLRSSPVEVIKECVSNPQKRLILVKTNKVKDEIMELLGEAREKVTLLTVEEAKGLEWEGALLWNFFIPRHEEITKNDWENVFIAEKRHAFQIKVEREGINPYALAYEFNLLHVGLTRPRRFLFMYDEDPIKNVINLGGKMDGLVTEIDNKQFSAYWRTTMPSPRDLFTLAVDLETRDQKQALQFYKIAAREYEKAKKPEDAAKCFERAREYKLAASCYGELGNVSMQEKMLAYDSESLAHDLELEGKPEGAKKHWEDAGKHWVWHCRHSREKGRWEDLIGGYESATKAYKNAGLFREAATCLQQRAKEIPREKKEYVIVKAKSLHDAALCWEKAGLVKFAIEAMNSAINTGRDEIIKSGERISIGGEIPEIWVAKCFVMLADYYAKIGDIPSAAQATMDVAKYFSDAEKRVEGGEKESCLEQQLRYLHKAAEYYKGAGQMKEAIDVLKRSVELSKERVNRYGITRLGDLNRSWEQLIDCLKDSGQIIESINETVDYIEHLGRRNEKERGIKIAETQIEWCEEKHHDGAIKLLNLVKGWYERGEEYRLVGKTIERIGKMQERLGNRRDATSSYTEAGRNYLKAKSIDLALNSFEQGLNVAMSEILPPSSVGYYCFKDVAVESLIPGLEAEARYEIVKEWIDKAATYFAEEFQQSMPLIQDYIKTWESKLEKIPKDSKERNEVLRKCGWTWLCLMSTCQTALKQGVAFYEAEKMMKEASEKSHDCFKKIVDKELDDREVISYILENMKKYTSL
jgi:superfamily I DNA/RNA helicase